MTILHFITFVNLLTDGNAEKDGHDNISRIGAAKGSGCNSQGAHHQADVIQ